MDAASGLPPASDATPVGAVEPAHTEYVRAAHPGAAHPASDAICAKG